MGLFDWKKNKKESKEELEENAVLTPDNAEVSADGKNEQDAKAEKDEKNAKHAEEGGFFKRLVNGMTKTRDQLAEGLNRISLALGISSGCINLVLLCLTVFEELSCYLWEQCIGKHVLILLLVLSHFLLDICKLWLDQIGWTACDRFGITNTLLLYFLIKWLYSLSELSGKELLGLFCYHLIALAGYYIQNSLCTNDL